MSSNNRSGVGPPIDAVLHDRIMKALTPQRPRILVVGGVVRMYDQVLMDREDLFLFRFVEKGRNLRNLSVPKTVGCIVNVRALGHGNVEHVEKVCPADVTIIPSVYDTGVINRVLTRILGEQPPVQKREEKEEESEMKATTPPPATSAAVPEPQPPMLDEKTMGDIVILGAIYARMPVRSAGYAWLGDKTTGIAIRSVCGADIETRDINRRFIQKGWLLPRTLPGNSRVGSYGATEAGVQFLKSHGETVPDLWCPAEEVRATPPSGLAAKIAQLEQEISADIGLDGELQAAKEKVEELEARMKDRDERKERLKQIIALLED